MNCLISVIASITKNLFFKYSFLLRHLSAKCRNKNFHLKALLITDSAIPSPEMIFTSCKLQYRQVVTNYTILQIYKTETMNINNEIDHFIMIQTILKPCITVLNSSSYKLRTSVSSLLS